MSIYSVIVQNIVKGSKYYFVSSGADNTEGKYSYKNNR
jgi:hypothetical protein